jgi:hypothetical protein
MLPAAMTANCVDLDGNPERVVEGEQGSLERSDEVGEIGVGHDCSRNLLRLGRLQGESSSVVKTESCWSTEVWCLPPRSRRFS